MVASGDRTSGCSPPKPAEVCSRGPQRSELQRTMSALRQRRKRSRCGCVQAVRRGEAMATAPGSCVELCGAQPSGRVAWNHLESPRSPRRFSGTDTEARIYGTEA
ncbi:hypothetical protein NDU88_003597 [Pleurodeles waltl]|uniref:Uncharacterized protein n=1 Tax=Pleurodeles waltl TaxID=8319 RepID=A0AAV7SGF0_PLEWA|nr:hypothetical protein NDU88_003597 [Pleurodeles waltl]